MRLLLSFALVALPVSARAERDQEPAAPRLRDRTTPVIGGTQAPAGKWPDAAAVLWSGSQGCSGTLVAPTIVITAGHCVLGGAPNAVLLGAISESSSDGGETIRVATWHEYPSSQYSVDAAILILERPATVAPRAIATGWARFDIKNDAPVALVGFGTTDRNGNIDSSALMEATSTITDFNCTLQAGCNSSARPDGELGAGGMGIDTCPGDSGGPLYLVTPYGNFLAGITSRGYADNNYYCSEGGIYGRADKIVDWIEEMTGITVARGPEPSAPLLVATRGTPGEVKVEPNDPKADAVHGYQITRQPTYGRAAIRQDGMLRVCPNADVVGGDSLTVKVTDANATGEERAVTVTLPILIEDGDPDDDCDPEAFGDDGGGCCDTRRSATGSLPLALFVAVVLRRRRRTR